MTTPPPPSDTGAAPGDARGPQQLHARAGWPYENLHRATAALRAQLREALLDELVTASGGVTPAVQELPDWQTLVVTGPVTSTVRGSAWFSYTATATVTTTTIRPLPTPGSTSAVDAPPDDEGDRPGR